MTPTPTQPAGAFHLDVGDGHVLWAADTGPRTATPVLFLHGGPGSGCSPSVRGLFDPVRHRAILMDQRGAGDSTPARSRHANTTWDLVADIERLRLHLGIESWFVTGGSWGATLALAYAQTHPTRVRGLVLRAVFLGTQAELHWAFNTGLAAFFPDHHARLMELTGGDLTRLWPRVLHPDPAVHRPAALAFHRAERAMSELRPGPAATDAARPDPGPDVPVPASTLMEAHYFAHDCWLEPDQLIANVGRMADIPGILIQARQDLLCPPATSARLAAHWPRAQLRLVSGAGHTLNHVEVFDAVKTALAEMVA